MKTRLDQLEARLQSLIEGTVARLFPLNRRQPDLRTHLVEALRLNIQTRSDGSYWAPNLFILALPPHQAEYLQVNWTLLDELAQILLQAGSEAGLQFASNPVVKVAPDPALSHDEIRVLAQFQQDHLGDTKALVSQPEEYEPLLPPNAFFIVNGLDIFNLQDALINIGRSPENHLVVNDPRVSREHAQIRAVHGRYVIFDLDSTGGTFVNQQRITQSVLYTGDVISLAGVPLIYGQDESPSAGSTQRMPAAP